ncbi:MAG: S9 family peptidase [Steroidobacteraceae bacterium]
MVSNRPRMTNVARPAARHAATLARGRVPAALLLAALLLAGPAATAASPPSRQAASPLTLERVFATPDLSGPTLRSPRFSPDGRLVVYLRGADDDMNRFDLWAYDIAQRRHRKLVDARALVPAERALSAEEEARRERLRIASLRGIVDYQFSADSRFLLVPLSGDLYLYDLRAPVDRAVRALTQTDAYETEARFSPRGRWVSFVRDQNLHVLELATGREQAITRDGGGTLSYGVAEFIAQEEMDRNDGHWWSPDETRLAYARVDESTVDEVERFEINADNVQVIRQRYPAAGRPNARVDLFVHDLASGAARAVDARDEYLARVAWFPESDALAVQTHSRDQRTLVLWRVDAASGTAQALVTERSATWVELHDELTFLPRSRQIVWASSRSGQRHLYLIDYRGNDVRALTAGDWAVVGDDRGRAIRGIDEARGRIYFMANRDTPLERHLYSASLRGAGVPAAPLRLTTPGGWHSVAMSRDARRWLDTRSDPDTPPSLTLRSVAGDTAVDLVPNRLDARHPYAPYVDAHVTTEFGTLQAADGQTLHWQMLRPKQLAPGKRHPVVVDTYGGPGVQRVRRAWMGGARAGDGFFRQILAQRGYIVFTLDNRGSGFRGVRFESALHRRMGTVEIEDQVRGVEFLRTLPYVDPARIGIWGWSYGGYVSLLALLRAPEHFAAAVAGAPVTDWRLYDTHYTERYMGTPAENAAGYDEGMAMTHAEALRGRLLLVHGMADDNVLFTHSTAMMKRLQDLNKPFDVMVYPGSKHALIRFPSTGAHAYGSMLRFLDDALRPPGQPIGMTPP